MEVIIGIVFLVAIAVSVHCIAECIRRGHQIRKRDEEIVDLERAVKHEHNIAVNHQSKVSQLQTKIEGLNDTIADMKRVLNSGWRDLRVRHIMIDMTDYPYNQVAVVGVSMSNPDIFCIVKIFEYDKNDPEGYDDAVREAEELIDVIRKA